MRKTMFNCIVVAVLCVCVLTNVPTVHGDCFKETIRQASETFCTCSNNSCQVNTADNVQDFRFCYSVLPGEMYGQTVCNTQLQSVGTRLSCSMGMNQSVRDAELAAIATCLVLYYICLAGTASSGGLAIPICIAGNTACIAGAVATFNIPDCWMYQCSTNASTSRDIDRYVTTGMGGVGCTGE